MELNQQHALSTSDVPLTGRPTPGGHGQKPIRNEAKGVAVELLLKAVLIDRGFLVSDPILSTSYDFITDWDGVINTIQVRSTACLQRPSTMARGGYYRIEVPKVGGFSILLAHVGPLKQTFVIPWNEVDRRWICVHKERVSRYEKYKERWNLLEEAH
jgi:hypothetical protein